MQKVFHAGWADFFLFYRFDHSRRALDRTLCPVEALVPEARDGYWSKSIDEGPRSAWSFVAMRSASRITRSTFCPRIFFRSSSL